MTIAKVIGEDERRIYSCQASATVEEASRILSERRIGALPVFDSGRLAGIFSERDLLYSIAKEGADRSALADDPTAHPAPAS